MFHMKRRLEKAVCAIRESIMSTHTQKLKITSISKRKFVGDVP